MPTDFTVLTTSPGFATRGDHAEQLARAGAHLLRHAQDDAELPELVAGARYLVAGLVPVDARLLDAAPGLRGVLKHGVGLDSIDIRACSQRGLPVLNTPGANASAVAELALGAIFALWRNTVPGHLSVTSGGWDRRVGRELGGATLGILGFGQIGRALAGLARGIGMAVIAHDPWADLETARAMGVTLAEREAVLRGCDVLSVHVAGGPDTRGLIGVPEIAMMRPGTTILNFARGGIVDLDALHAALETGQIGRGRARRLRDRTPQTSRIRSFPIRACSSRRIPGPTRTSRCCAWARWSSTTS
ncbi:NAD(P)-dependent oxidoreductase [Salipiger mucosus]|uniref:D-3-phosphoglycerate dehydrogenase n=1 Tax=Salipiger mucosus DSM 16094 TaxID=1123237 RepID=S9QBG5_9RHOB|nr:NAD(P)-dependent oxidoreductase [Salipiger mucosus]EPX78756.1 D-3-phosphoglycerate dehydrogenase [Salipiger mucosus DSM 16094]